MGGREQGCSLGLSSQFPAAEPAEPPACPTGSGCSPGSVEVLGVRVTGTNKLVGAAPRSMKAARERTVAEMKPQGFSQNCNFLQKLFQKLHKIKNNVDYCFFLVVGLEEVCLPFQHRLLLHAAARYPLCHVGVSPGFTFPIKNT